MGNRIRPTVLGNVPVLAICLGAGLVAFIVDDVPAVVRASGAGGGVIGLIYAALLLTTWVQFGDGYVRVSTLGRERCFRSGETTLRLHRFSAGFFAQQTGVELRSAQARLNLPLGLFSRKDRVLIQRELRNRFNAGSAK